MPIHSLNKFASNEICTLNLLPMHNILSGFHAKSSQVFSKTLLGGAKRNNATKLVLQDFCFPLYVLGSVCVCFFFWERGEAGCGED